MTKAPTQSFDLGNYDYDPSSPPIEQREIMSLLLVNYLKMQTFQKARMVEDS